MPHRSHPRGGTRAIITDGFWRKSLSAIRSLGKAGFRVTVMGDSWLTTGFWSRFTSHRVMAPLASRDPEGFGAALMAGIRREPGAVVFPMEDPSLMWVSAHRAEISRYARVLLPPAESLAVAQDKGTTLRIAAELGLPCPRTWEPESAEEFAQLATELEPERFVVKPRSGTGSSGIVFGDQRDRDGWKKHWELFGPLLVQERISSDGKGQGVSLLFDQSGTCVAQFAHARLEQYPNSGGPSTDRESIHAPEIVHWSIALLKRLSWSGIGMVEWKVDPVSGKSMLMEINPRFWGSLELAVRAGVDFPALYAAACLGQESGPPPEYPANVRCRWMIPGELLRYLTQERKRREKVGEFLSGLPGLAEEWDPEDPRGALATVICTGALALNPRFWKYLRRS